MNASEESDAELIFVVSAQEAGSRLDVFLASHCSSTSRVRIRRGIDSGDAKVDGSVQKPSYKLVEGQRVTFHLPAPLSDGPQPEAIPVSLLYEDQAIAVVDKPPRMVVHPARGHWSGTLAVH